MGMRQTIVNGVCVAVVLMGIGSPVRAQSSSAEQRITAASAMMSLERVDRKPWHLKLDVTAFDDKGTNPNQGTIEVWHSGSDERTVYTFGDATNTTIKHGGQTYGVSNGSGVPFEASEVLQEVLHSGPEPDEINGSAPESHEHKFGKVSLDCIMLTQPIKGEPFVPLGLFPTYCLDTNDYIRSSYNFGGQTVILNGIGKFLDHVIPTQLDVLNDQIKVASGKIVTLATYEPQPEEFVPSAGMKLEGGEARLSGGVIAGNRISFTQPLYPEGAKQRHESGTVVLRAIISRTGHVRLLRPVSATNPEFVVAAIAAVRRWVYKPYLLNGEPTEVDTTITVNFAIN